MISVNLSLSSAAASVTTGKPAQRLERISQDQVCDEHLDSGP